MAQNYFPVILQDQFLKVALALNVLHAMADPGGGGVPGFGPPFFWPINAFEWGNIAGTPPLSWVWNPLF